MCICTGFQNNIGQLFDEAIACGQLFVEATASDQVHSRKRSSEELIDLSNDEPKKGRYEDEDDCTVEDDNANEYTNEDTDDDVTLNDQSLFVRSMLDTTPIKPPNISSSSSSSSSTSSNIYHGMGAIYRQNPISNINTVLAQLPIVDDNDVLHAIKVLFQRNRKTLDEQNATLTEQNGSFAEEIDLLKKEIKEKEQTIQHLSRRVSNLTGIVDTFRLKEQGLSLQLQQSMDQFQHEKLNFEERIVDLNHQNNVLRAECIQLGTQRDQMVVERDQIGVERDQMVVERDGLLETIAELRQSNQILTTQQQQFMFLCNTFQQRNNNNNNI